LPAAKAHASIVAGNPLPAFKELPMKNLMIVLALSLTAFASVAQAADATCDSQAADKKLAGAAKTSFLRKCNKDAGVATCDSQAADKKLAGAAKTSFVTKCNKDMGGATAAAAKPSAKDTCDAAAVDKKLAGAAKTSFTKKCVADAAKG
jgi:hypothetical protein